MNKIKNIFLAIIILFATSTSAFAKSKIKVISTIFPMYDWTREIIGNQKETNNNIDLTLLVGNGVDLHSYQPSIQDVAKISTTDIFIYVPYLARLAYLVRPDNTSYNTVSCALPCR